MLDGRDMCLGNPRIGTGMVDHFTSKRQASPRWYCSAWVGWRRGLGKNASTGLLVLVGRGVGLPGVVGELTKSRLIIVFNIPELFRAFSYIQEQLDEGENTKKKQPRKNTGAGKI